MKEVWLKAADLVCGWISLNTVVELTGSKNHRQAEMLQAIA